MEKYPRMLTIKEVAQFLSLSEKTIYRLVKTGTLPALKVGGQWRFEQKILDAWVARSVNGTQNKQKGVCVIGNVVEKDS